MKSKEQLEHALLDLRLEHRQVNAPASIGVRLRAAARAQSDRQRSLRSIWLFATAACVVLTLAVALYRPVSWHARPTEQVGRKAPLDYPEVSETMPAVDARNAKPASDLSSRVLRHPVLRGPVAAKFITLPASVTLPDPVATTLVRVRICTLDLRQLGVDVPELFASGTVMAEFALGEDGLARAVRLIEPGSSAEERTSQRVRELP